MNKPLRALIVEDCEPDTDLLLAELAQAWDEVTYERRPDGQAMKAQLSGRRWDVVLSDYSMPQFSGPAASRR